MIKKIVLTGGPCAGKSTALSRIENEFLERGYAVLVVSESATELIQGGIRPFGDQAVYGVDFQKIILTYQLNKEKSYEQAASYLEATGRNVIILYDRGVLDNKAYLEEYEWKKMLKAYGYYEDELMSRYDLVIHMVSAAFSDSNLYTLENNTARTETKEEARLLDTKTLQAWSGHSNLKIVDNAPHFDEKIENVLNECLALTGEKSNFRCQKKYIVDSSTLELPYFTNYCSKSIIKQFYLESGESNLECRIRESIIDENHYYSMTEQEKLENGTSILTGMRKLTKIEYENYLNRFPIVDGITKTRYTFVYEKECVRLDVFPNGLVLLEIEPMSKDYEICIPEGIKIIEDVSNKRNYQNKVLAKRLGNGEITSY